ncbi:MAG: hypothetical protein IKT41_05890 [Clostridia bacterium]|nr:hypothetical protein [Clostridia bacterium]
MKKWFIKELRESILQILPRYMKNEIKNEYKFIDVEGKEYDLYVDINKTVWKIDRKEK